MAIARGEGNFLKVIAEYKKVKLLILDEWLLLPLTNSETRDLLEIVEARCGRGSTIFCSQFEVDGWYQKIGDETIADAICDRIIHNAYTILLKGDSLRKMNGVIEGE